MSTGGDDRNHLTFEQAEGAEPLPSQLKLKEISQELRAKLWSIFHSSMTNSIYSPGLSARDAILAEPWGFILLDKHVMRDHRMADEFRNHPSVLMEEVKQIFVAGDYIKVLGFVQWVLRHPKKPYQLEKGIEWALATSHAAYSLVNGNTITPIGSDAERSTLERAFADVATVEFNGARQHQRNAAIALTEGRYSDSVRESIHAVESVARVLDPNANTLDPALSTLMKIIGIHPALKKGFSNLYGYTSDERGVRHALIEEGAAQVDETDALYMLGACAAFVSYLINKATTAGLIDEKK